MVYVTDFSHLKQYTVCCIVRYSKLKFLYTSYRTVKFSTSNYLKIMKLLVLGPGLGFL